MSVLVKTSINVNSSHHTTGIGSFGNHTNFQLPEEIWNSQFWSGAHLYVNLLVYAKAVQQILAIKSDLFWNIKNDTGSNPIKKYTHKFNFANSGK